MNNLYNETGAITDREENRIMKFCAVMSVKNINPRHLKAIELKLGEHDHFHFIAKRDGKWLVYQNVGRDLSDSEYLALKNYVKTWGGGEKVDCTNGILHMEVPEFLSRFFEKVNSIPGCRVLPNTFQNNGDAYVEIEFQKDNQEKVSEALMDFIAEESLFRKEVVYIGEQTGKLPYLLEMYHEFGNSLSDFSVLETLWIPRDEERQHQNMGIFENSGIFVPKYFINGEKDKIVARIKGAEIKGRADFTYISEEDGIVEFDVETKFFSDFYSEVIERYSGPIFLSLEVSNRGVSNYYIIEKAVQQLFIEGLNKHWKRDARSNHRNYVIGVHDLDKWLLKKEIPF